METIICNDRKYYLDDYATKSFRDTADQDYIAARMSYKANLVWPFLWSSLHAIEKYLKAILLFNEEKAKYGHDIEKLLESVETIEELDLRLPCSVKSFVKYLNSYGENRYFEGCAYLPQYALDSLDETVWYIRRYCYREFEPIIDITPKMISPLEQEQNPKNYNIEGLLEKIIKGRYPAAYDFLTWDNFFYGSCENECNRELIRKRQSCSSERGSTLTIWGDEAFKVLDEYVTLSPSTKKYFKNPIENNNV